MAGMLTLKELQQAVSAGGIDTVVACFPDMQGRLIGKRFQAEFFLGGTYQETHGCDYLQEDFADLGAFEGQAVVGRSRLHLRRATEDNSLAGTPSSFALISQSTA